MQAIKNPRLMYMYMYVCIGDLVIITRGLPPERGVSWSRVQLPLAPPTESGPRESCLVWNEDRRMTWNGLPVVWE